MIRLVSVTICVALGIGATTALCTACSAPDPVPAPRQGAGQARVLATGDRAPAASANVTVVGVRPETPPSRSGEAERAASPSLKVQRLVVTTGVKDREPVADGEALIANGSPIYAFAELSNPVGESENVRITFERKGGAERVGNVTLPVPRQVARHRTWAVTRFIRAPGVWDAVLWSESGAELGRTSFEVTAS